MLFKKRKHVFKIIVVGDTGVGKTSLLRRYVSNEFSKSIQHTISDNYFKSQIEFHSGDIVHLQLWDFGGQAKHRHLLNNFVAGARGALILIDTSKPLKIISILEWVNMVRQADISLPILLVGTKNDLKKSVKDEEIEHVIEIFKLHNYIETSAKENFNVFRVFYKISEAII